MSTVPFTTTCDFCGARAEEYASWPSCKECLQDCCPACMEPGTLDEGDGERRDQCLCQACWREVNPEPERDEAYERAASRDRADGFSRTGGKDWT